jgi:hypothetical protein
MGVTEGAVVVVTAGTGAEGADAGGPGVVELVGMLVPSTYTGMIWTSPSLNMHLRNYRLCKFQMRSRY